MKCFTAEGTSEVFLGIFGHKPKDLTSEHFDLMTPLDEEIRGLPNSDFDLDVDTYDEHKRIHQISWCHLLYSSN